MADLTDQDVRAELDAAAKAPPKDAPPHPVAAAPMTPIQMAQLPPPPRATAGPGFIDSLVANADNFASQHGQWAQAIERLTRASVSGITKGAVSAADSVKSAAESSGKGLAMAEDPAHAEDAAAGVDPITPMYDHARSAVMGFRDSVALKDPNVPESLIEGAWQFVPSFLMFSRATGAIGGLANLWKGESALGTLKAGGSLADAAVSGAKRLAGASARFVAADAPNAAIMQGPHDPRVADMVSLLRTSEGKFGDMLRAASPDGNLLGHFISYLSDRNETEAEGRWKNVVDSFGAGAAISGLMHSAGSILKQGWSTLHFMADNNMGSMSDVPVPKLPAETPLAHEGETPAAGAVAAPAEDAVAKVRGTLTQVNTSGGEHPLHDVLAHLADNLDTSTPERAFYKDLFSDLKQHNLKSTLVAAEASDNPRQLGHYTRSTDAVSIAPQTLQGNGDNFLHTLGHEATHAATVNALRQSPFVQKALAQLASEAALAEPVMALPKEHQYGAAPGKPTAVTAAELVAEANASRPFQLALKASKSPLGSGTLWDDFKDLTAHILKPGNAKAAVALAASPLFEKMLTAQKQESE